jgi:integrase
MAEYLRGKTWWIAYTGPTGENVRESTKQGNRAVAKRIYQQRKREVVDGTWRPPSSGRAVTLADYAERWISRNHARKLATARDYEQRCRDHVLPVLGRMRLEDVRPRHVRAFVDDLVGAGKLAPRTIHHVYDTLRSLCRDAVIDEAILATPCVLPPGTLPEKVDRDPEWRATAIFTRAEVETLISDDRIPDDRRAFYALMLLTGSRFGEVAGRRWRDLDLGAEPLHRLTIATQYSGRRTKTKRAREVPVHPTLAAILADWRIRGFPLLMGRHPGPEDWIVPSRRGAHRSVRHMHRRLQEDLERVGLRGRRQHDTRRTFITLCLVDGARKDVLRQITHGARGDIMDAYTTLPWPTLCEAVACLKVEVRAGSLHNLLHTGKGRRRIPGETRGLRGGADGTRSPGPVGEFEGSAPVSRASGSGGVGENGDG